MCATRKNFFSTEKNKEKLDEINVFNLLIHTSQLNDSFQSK